MFHALRIGAEQLRWQIELQMHTCSDILRWHVPHKSKFFASAVRCSGPNESDRRRTMHRDAAIGEKSMLFFPLHLNLCAALLSSRRKGKKRSCIANRRFLAFCSPLRRRGNDISMAKGHRMKMHPTIAHINISAAIDFAARAEQWDAF